LITDSVTVNSQERGSLLFAGQGVSACVAIHLSPQKRFWRHSLWFR